MITNEVQETIEKLSYKIDGRCPICGENDWVITEGFCLMSSLNNTAKLSLLPMMCEHCGYTSLYTSDSL